MEFLVCISVVTLLAWGKVMCSIQEILLSEKYVSESQSCCWFSLFRAYKEHLEG